VSCRVANNSSRQFGTLEMTDFAIAACVQQNVATIWHSTPTCPLKPLEEGGVVDNRLSAYGVKNLKIAGKCSMYIVVEVPC